MGRYCRTWAFASLLLLASGIHAAQQAPAVPVIARPDCSRLERLFVDKVIDGDTVSLRRGDRLVTFRLMGVDAPETLDPREPVDEYGREASVFLANLLKGEEVWVEHNPSELLDKYQRELAYLHRVPDGLNVNAEVIRQGYGHALNTFPHPQMEAFRLLEVRARLAEKGLWGSAGASTQPMPLPPTAPGVGATPLAPGASAPAVGESPQAATVYVTRTGAKYHSAGCRFLSKSSIPMPLEEARKRYTACSVCRPPQ